MPAGIDVVKICFPFVGCCVTTCFVFMWFLFVVSARGFGCYFGRLVIAPFIHLVDTSANGEKHCKKKQLYHYR